MTHQELVSAISIGMPWRGPAVYLEGQDIDLGHIQAMAGYFSGILCLKYMWGVELPYLRNGLEIE
jgi:hypothetical protein